ncbi:unnamed protein product, partial [Rhizoctonia solani]
KSYRYQLHTSHPPQYRAIMTSLNSPEAQPLYSLSYTAQEGRFDLPFLPSAYISELPSDHLYGEVKMKPQRYSQASAREYLISGCPSRVSIRLQWGLLVHPRMWKLSANARICYYPMDCLIMTGSWIEHFNPKPYIRLGFLDVLYPQIVHQ